MQFSPLVLYVLSAIFKVSNSIFAFFLTNGLVTKPMQLTYPFTKYEAAHSSQPAELGTKLERK